MAMLYFDYDLVIWLKTIIVNSLKDKIVWGDNIWFKNLQKRYNQYRDWIWPVDLIQD